jgi:hypothetical protein
MRSHGTVTAALRPLPGSADVLLNRHLEIFL